MDVDVILFDWGGTLARVSRQVEAWAAGAGAVCTVLGEQGLSHAEAASKLAETIRAAERRAEADPSHVEYTVGDVLRAWAAACGWTLPDQRTCDEAIRTFGQHWIGCLDVLPGAVEAVATLRERGYRLGLASNCSMPEEYCRVELERQGIAAHLHAATYSCEVGYRKPARVMYETALRRVRPDGDEVDPRRVLFVGDSPVNDVEGPASMGMRTALVEGETSIWSAEARARVRPDVRVNSVRELLDVLPPRT